MYQEQAVETMPWYIEGLDQDFSKAIQDYSITNVEVLDLGTGPGTQAIALAKLGFKVTATDLSKAAVDQATNLAKLSGLNIDFFQDDILNSKIARRFDLILDRGMFHVLSAEDRLTYIEQIAKILKEDGLFFLKTFSYKEKGSGGPYKFRPVEIRDYFSASFKIISIEDTVFHGTLKEFPKALFCVLKIKHPSNAE